MSGYDDYTFEWDPNKAATNLTDHGVPMSAGRAVFSDPWAIDEDDPFSRGEYRYIAIGFVAGRLLTVHYSQPEERVIRLISVRKATPVERRWYDDPLRQS